VLDVIQSEYIRYYLNSLYVRAAQAGEALDWLDGQQTLYPDELVPPFDSGSEGETAWLRLKEQVQSFGPRAYRFKRDGAIGDVNWGGRDPKDIDDRLTAIDLRDLATHALKSLMGPGIAAAWAYQPGKLEGDKLVASGQPRIQRLGGHVEPLYAEDDGAGDVMALYQVRSNPMGTYTIRIYEYSDVPGQGTIYEWRRADEMFAVGKEPSQVLENTNVPRFQMATRDQDGYPRGEFLQVLPIIKAELANQLRILRVADAHAWPILYMFGAGIDGSTLGSNRILTSPNAAAQAGRIEAGNMAALFEQQERTLERIRSDLSLPINSINGGSWPSGEALAQANSVYLSSCRGYAGSIGRMLTEVVADYAELLGIPRDQAPPVSVSINQEHAREALTKQARDDYREGLITFRAAVGAVAPFYPHWSDEEVEAFILQGERPLKVGAFIKTGVEPGDEEDEPEGDAAPVPVQEEAE